MLNSTSKWLRQVCWLHPRCDWIPHRQDSHPCNIFVKLSDTLYTYALKGDFSYATVDDVMPIPLVIGDIFPEHDWSERSRLLCQAVALARLGNQLLKKPAPPFVVMVIIVCGNFHAERHLVYMPTPDQNRHVSRAA